MDRRLVVSTECPTCGAPLEFAEGSNAVQCGHCRANLLVTGRKRVLSYFVAPKVTPRAAAETVRRSAREAGDAVRVGDSELYFVPYYRLRGHDLRWECGEAPRRLAPLPSPGAGVRAMLARAIFESTDHGAPEMPEGVLHDRYLDRNFIACEVPSSALYSLGIRLGVVRLHLFHGQAPHGIGRVAGVRLAPAEALARGMDAVATGGGDLLQRRVLGKVLSLVYYPFCVVDLEGRGEPRLAIVDGVSGSVMERDGPASTRAALEGASAVKTDTVGFRPLLCPNCGWDLPVEPEHVIFVCKGCERAWQIEGSELQPMAHELAAVPAVAGQRAVEHLPFWIVEAAGAGSRRFFVPAFRYRRLKILCDLAREISARERAYSAWSDPPLPRRGCYYDQEDAECLAEISYPGLTPSPADTIERLRRQPLSFAGHRLVWLPCYSDGHALRAPFTGRALEARLLG